MPLVALDGAIAESNGRMGKSLLANEIAHFSLGKRRRTPPDDAADGAALKARGRVPEGVLLAKKAFSCQIRSAWYTRKNPVIKPAIQAATVPLEDPAEGHPVDDRA
jgi:hypothetical protein